MDHSNSSHLGVGLHGGELHPPPRLLPAAGVGLRGAHPGRGLRHIDRVPARRGLARLVVLAAAAAVGAATLPRPGAVARAAARRAGGPGGPVRPLLVGAAGEVARAQREVLAVLLVHVPAHAHLAAVRGRGVAAAAVPHLEALAAGLGARAPLGPGSPAAVPRAVGHHQLRAVARAAAVRGRGGVAGAAAAHAVVPGGVGAGVPLLGALLPAAPGAPAAVPGLGGDGTPDEVLLPVRRPRVLVRRRHALALLLAPPAVRVHRVQARGVRGEPANISYAMEYFSCTQYS